MGQQLCKTHLEIFDGIINNDTTFKYDMVSSKDDEDDISFFSSSKSVTATESDSNHRTSSSERIFIKRIQDQLSILTNPIVLDEIDTQINDIFIEKVPFVDNCYEILQQITKNFENQKLLRISLMDKFKRDKSDDVSKSFVDSFSNDENENKDEQQKRKAQQLSYFAVQSLSSVLLILIKSAEKNDPTIIHQILTLVSQLCEQIPMKYLSSLNNSDFFFNSIKPLINYINELSLSNDPIISKQALKILLNFSIIKTSFKDILSLLSKLIFDTINVHHVRSLFIQLNNGLIEVNYPSDSDSTLYYEDDGATPKETTVQISLDYLESIGVYPNSQLMKLDEKLFTGQFISSIILAYIDFDNDIHSNKQLKNGSIDSSFSLEFHPDTFKQLFDIIEQLSTQNSSKIVLHILIVCIKLFTTHLQFLCAMKSNLNRDLLTTNNKIRTHISYWSSYSEHKIDLTMFTTENELTKWFRLLLKLAYDEDQKPKRMMICKEASKALVCIVNQRTWSFLEKLSFIHQYIIENQHPILIKEFLVEMNKEETLLCWIEVLCENSSNELNRTIAAKILYSFIDIYFNSSNEQIQNILLLFQQLLLYRLVSRSSDNTNNEFYLPTLTGATSFVSEYITYIFKKSVKQAMIMNELFNSILIGLYLMTQINVIFDFVVIQPIFATILPLLADYVLQNTITNDGINNHRGFISWLLGKMCYVMLSGSSIDSLEMRYTNTLKSIIFAGGCERQATEGRQYLLHLYNSNLAVYSQFPVHNQAQESSLDKEFLMSIYNNIGEGAELISKMKMFVKNKHHLIQKSIEQQTNDLCAAIFAVYIKHYRRINLAKYELFRRDQSKPHNELLSIFEYASNVQTVFANIKAQGDDCNELYEQIKANTLFLLFSVKESDLIPIIEEDLPQIIPEISKKKEFKLQRQNSRWTKAKYVIRLLRNLMKACTRFKRLMLAKKQSACNSERNLKQTIDAFIYERFYKIPISTINAVIVKQMELKEIENCLCRQYERAMTRLMTYRFFQTFIQQICNLKDSNQALILLNFYLPRLRSTTLEWSYLENISAVNKQLKEEIRKTYYCIIKMILSYLLASTTFQSKILSQNIFYLLNVSYESEDICHIYEHQFAVTLFTSFISYIQNPDDSVSFDFRFVGFYWFRLFVVKLCENIQMDILRGLSNQLLRRQREIVFTTLIFNELRGLKQLKDTLSMDTENTIDDSLKHIAVDWFYHALAKDISIISNKFEIDLYINQYLVLLLRCVYYYEHVRSICATVDYIEELLFIYHHSKHNTTVLLSLKILRQLIPFLPETADGKSSVLIEKLLIEILFSIGENFISQQMRPEIVTELIYIYRTIMSVNSAWQMLAIQLVLDSIKSHLNMKSIEANDQSQISHLLASLGVLGGYIQPICLGSSVTVSGDETRLAIVIEIDKSITESNTSDGAPYFVQYLQTNQKESVAMNQLQLEIDVLPPNLSSLPNANVFIHSVLDALGYFIQTDTSLSESALLLQLKRRSISALYHIVNTQKLIEIFMQKPYATILAQLSISDSLPKTRRQPADLHLFSKQHLEQYSLSLDTCERLKQIVEVDENENKNMLNDTRTANNRLLVDTLSMSTWKYNGWRPYATKAEIESFKKGRLGSNEISLIPMPSTAADMEVFQECGSKHQFKGHISLTSQNTHARLPTFIVANLQVNEGKWYYCVRVPDAGIQVGWATNGFTPSGNHGVAIGDDQYSWSYDGARDILLNNGVYSDRFDDIHWKENDVCGCGIEIDGENTNIKYWLNGKFLGTAFRHQSNIASSSTQCNLLPNGPSSAYFPGVSIQFDNYPTASCEFIFSPEDMQECPLPDGYKPLLLPKIIHIENSIVAYPYSAYLVDDEQQDYFYKRRTMTSTKLLRDFVNDHHLEIDFSLEENQLVLPEKNPGFSLSIDNEATSFTISFDFQILSTMDDVTDDQVTIQLLTLDIMEAFSIHIPLKKSKEKTRTVIVLLLKEQQTLVYINDDCQTFETHFQTDTKAKLDFRLLPKTSARITNIGVWKYALSEDQIHRLFTYGLFYVAVDYQQMKEHRKRANTFSFTKNEFSDELLVPFDEPFEESIWEKKKKQVDHDESKYFKSNDQSTIDFFGNQTYLVLDKSNDIWFEYTLILDISIPNWPITNEQLTLIILNETLQLYINHDGKLCLVCNEEDIKSHSKMSLNEYFRLWISIRDQSVKIYVNGSLEIEFSSDDDDHHQFHTTSNRFDLFREIDLTKNTTNENTLRIQCQSITFLNRSIPIDEHIAQPNCSLETIVAPPLSIIVPSLIAIGYKNEWILSVIKRYNTTNIQTIDTLIREHKQQLFEEDFENKQNHYLKILSRLSPMIDQKKLKDIINPLKIDTDKQIAILSELILTNWNDLQIPKSEDNLDEHEEISGENKWFDQSIRGLAINENVTEYTIYKLFDLSQPQQEQTTSFIQNQRKRNQKSIQYSHQNISRKQYLESRTACEHGLTIIYARYTVLNMLKIWSNRATTLFPLEKFDDCTFLVTLLRLMDYYYTYTDIHTNENIDQINSLINSILKAEIKQLFQHIEIRNEMNEEMFQNKTSFLFQLQKNIISQIINILLEPSLLEEYSDNNDAIVDEQVIIKQPSLNFIFKILHLFVELLKDQSFIKQDQIEILVSLLFPRPMINLIFDLFIVVPTHQSKFFLLQLFSRLMQKSKQFHLTESIQHFLTNLLIECSSNTTSASNRLPKNVETVIIELIFLILSKQKEEQITMSDTKNINEQRKLKLKLDELPQNVRDIFTVIDVINILTGQTKTTLLIEAFFAQSQDYLGSGFKLSQEEFEKSNIYFDANADQQLMNLMNNDPLLDTSFSDFIRSLPTESVVNSIFYKNYLSLSNIPADCIQIRAKFIYQLNQFIEDILPLIDFSLLSEESYLIDKIQTIKIYLLYSMKLQLFEEILDKTDSGYNDDWLIVHFDTVKASTATENSEHTMFHQAYEQLHADAHITFRRQDFQLWHAEYVGMHSTDQGGPYRDSISRISSDICSSRLSLFILCSNARTNSGLNRDCWIPNVFPPNKPIPNHFKKQYRFVGQLMGMAIRKKHYLDLKFPLLLWKQLLRDEITIEDIQAIDVQSFTIINEMEKNIEQTKPIDVDQDINYLFNSIMSELRFDVVSSAGQTYELIPGGIDIPITAANFKQYCTSYRQYRLNEFSRQIEFIRQGLFSVVSCYYLSLFTANELEEAVCGKGQIDVELLKRNTQYGTGYRRDSPVIQRFWTVLGEMFNDEQRKLFLIFVWGRNTLPCKDEDFECNFTISIYDVDDNQVDRALPRSHTCSFSIDLPEYSTTEIMYERLNYAITYCSSIDADGNMNEAPVTIDDNSDSSLDEE